MTTATVKFAAGEPRDTKNGPRINAVLTIDETGEEVRIWGKPGEQPVASWTKNQKVQLEKNGQYWNPAKGATAAPQQAAPAQSAPQAQASAGFHMRLEAKALDDEATQHALNVRAAFLADLYSSIYYRLSQGADSSLPFDDGKIKPEDLHAAAATVFIQVSKIHFDK